MMQIPQYQPSTSEKCSKPHSLSQFSFVLMWPVSPLRDPEEVVESLLIDRAGCPFVRDIEFQNRTSSYLYKLCIECEDIDPCLATK